MGERAELHQDEGYFGTVWLQEDRVRYCAGPRRSIGFIVPDWGAMRLEQDATAVILGTEVGSPQ